MAVELRTERGLSAEQVADLVKARLPQWISESPELCQRLVAIFGSEPATILSYQEFLDQVDGGFTEWVNGVVSEMSPPSTRHQLIVGFLYQLMQPFAEEHVLGAVILAPYQMKLRNGREPDLLYVAAAHLERLTENFLDGPADIAVEVISPESVARDRGEKFVEYAEGGVREYWLIDPRTQWAEFYHLDGDFYRPAFTGSEGIYRSQVLVGFWLDVAWLWQEPLPKTLDVLRELGIVG